MVGGEQALGNCVGRTTRLYCGSVCHSTERKPHHVLNASLRNQCYSSRFYGDDPSIEHALAGIEGAAATVIRDILATKRLPTPGSDDHWTALMRAAQLRAAASEMLKFLRDFAMWSRWYETADRRDRSLDDTVSGHPIPGIPSDPVLPIA